MLKLLYESSQLCIQVTAFLLPVPDLRLKQENLYSEYPGGKTPPSPSVSIGFQCHAVQWGFVAFLKVCFAFLQPVSSRDLSY